MSENQEQHKTWIMLKRAIPPIVPTFPESGSGAQCAHLFDAQWNTSNGHDSTATQWQYIDGGYMRSYMPTTQFNITNGVWVDKNYLQFDGTGKMAAITQKNLVSNNALEVFVLEGIGELYTKKISSDVRNLTIYEDRVEYRHYNQFTKLYVPGKDIRMLCANKGRLVAYDKHGNRYTAYNSQAITDYSGMRAATDTSVFFNGFVGKVYSMKLYTRYNYWDGIIMDPAKPTYTALDKEWEYAKNRFRLN